MVEQALAQAELDWRFLTFEVDDDHLTEALKGLDVLGFRGVMLAAEFRGQAIDRLAQLTPRAERVGSVNCLVRDGENLVGDNTYGAAFLEALGGDEKLAGNGILVIGRGRVAQTIAATACDSGAASVYIADSNQEAVSALADHVRADRSTTSVVPITIDDNKVLAAADVSIVVFAPDDEDDTQRPVIDTSAINGQLTIVDTRLRGSRTGLVKFASEQGAIIIDGVDLFARETALALELWTGLAFDRAPLQELAEEFLGV